MTAAATAVAKKRRLVGATKVANPLAPLRPAAVRLNSPAVQLPAAAGHVATSNIAVEVCWVTCTIKCLVAVATRVATAVATAVAAVALLPAVPPRAVRLRLANRALLPRAAVPNRRAVATPV